ncbi:MAG: DEAD/DEAH box helicase, partial [Acidobacteriota bacterium]
YGTQAIGESNNAPCLIFTNERKRILRDTEMEDQTRKVLELTGFKRWQDYQHSECWTISKLHLPQAVQELVAAGWRVEAEGRIFRNPGNFRFNLTSGIDWFELHGKVEYGETSVSIPRLLKAMKRKETKILLDDGSYGMLPEQWLDRYGMFLDLGTLKEDHVQFRHSQAGLLDVLLEEEPEARCDEVFLQLRKSMQSFDGVEPADPPAGFHGSLRQYQRIGLGWMHFLQRFGFGGCLADDMGLGKTIQVLALLEERRCLRENRPSSETIPPSLVVMPKSLVFNWLQEAERFTPGLRILDHTGGERIRSHEHFDDYDVVFTTYGTLRRDAPFFKNKIFDYIVLDEAQAIKNAATESSKAARILKGHHRLALSGTPIENHIGELWSLFEFLNPGMLGSVSAFQSGRKTQTKPDDGHRALLARALRPFILRRTKKQVAPDLPDKVEQTLYCKLEPEQKALYDELREHYRNSLLQRLEADGINRSKMYVLEALLRLRQAAIHPGLVDRARMNEPSAKMDMLMPKLMEILDEGHKALVFSQFTSVLDILRKRLAAEDVDYEYLDGQTRDRAAPVERFQNDPEAKLFLISLKAGGLGLNLTAAEYVFLLDPWWNPAVEAQAVDRTHRIGQTRSVFAYRLIAKDTVEEKVLALQETKREIADAIINHNNSLIRNLNAEDLELLLS